MCGQRYGLATLLAFFLCVSVATAQTPPDLYVEASFFGPEAQLLEEFDTSHVLIISIAETLIWNGEELVKYDALLMNLAGEVLPKFVWTCSAPVIADGEIISISTSLTPFEIAEIGFTECDQAVTFATGGIVKLIATLPPTTILIEGVDTGIDDFEYAGQLASAWFSGLAENAKNHGQYVSGVARLSSEMRKAGQLSKDQRQTILELVTHSNASN